MRYFGHLGGFILLMSKKVRGIVATSILLISCVGQVAIQSPPPPIVQPPFSEIPSESLSPSPEDLSSNDKPNQGLPDIPINEKGEEEEKVETDKKIEAGLEGREVFFPVIEEETEKEDRLASLAHADLRVNDIFIDSKKKLVVSITNIGETPIPLETGKLNILIDGTSKGSYHLKNLLKQPVLLPQESHSLITPLTPKGHREIQAHIDFSPEVKELNKENNLLKKVLEGPPIGPDIMVKDFQLTEDLNLTILLSNVGESDLWRGTTIRVRIHVNNRLISEFDHLVSETLKANLGNHYILHPPYQIRISGILRVSVSIFPKLTSNDIQPENNTLRRTFIIFPFRIGPQGREEFSFSFSPHLLRSKDSPEKIKVEARWEGFGFPLRLSFKKTGIQKGISAFQGKSPMKVEFPILVEDIQDENVWNILISNLIDQRVEGHLIIQHP